MNESTVRKSSDLPIAAFGHDDRCEADTRGPYCGCYDRVKDREHGVGRGSGEHHPVAAHAPVAATAHYSAVFEEDDEGFYEARCNCGRSLGLFPTAEDTTDALMQHAYEEGYASALRDAVKMAGADRG